MKQLDPKAIWLFFFGYISGVFMLVIGLFCGLLLNVYSSDPSLSFSEKLLYYATNTLIMILIVVSALAYIWALLSYRFYKYQLRDDGFRKESGVIYKKYVTIPYDRIQNVDINRGIVARLLSLSDLQIHTAGIGGIATGEGKLPGLSKEVAEELRDELILRARQSRSQGL